MKPAVLFDLGNTLAAYYRSEQFGPILEAAIAEVFDELRSYEGITHVTLEAAIASAVTENREAVDFRFSPMVDRFARIFGVSIAPDSFAQTLCERFLRPIFASGRLYDDTLPVLKELRRRGHPTAIVSNAPWGSPPGMWRKELERLGLAEAVDCVVLCGDVGWRKPAPQIFKHAAQRVHREADECVFVGDDLQWDVAGSEAVGMHSILLDRDHRHRDHMGDRVGDLYGVLSAVVDRT